MFHRLTDFSNITNLTANTPNSILLEFFALYPSCRDFLRRRTTALASFDDPVIAADAVKKFNAKFKNFRGFAAAMPKQLAPGFSAGHPIEIQCFVCLRMLRDGSRVLTLSAAPGATFEDAVASPNYMDLSFTLGDEPEVSLQDGSTLADVKDIALRVLSLGGIWVKCEMPSGPTQRLPWMEVIQNIRDDMFLSQNFQMDIGLSLRDPLHAEKFRHFFRVSPPQLSSPLHRLPSHPSYRTGDIGEVSWQELPQSRLPGGPSHPPYRIGDLGEKQQESPQPKLPESGGGPVGSASNATPLGDMRNLVIREHVSQAESRQLKLLPAGPSPDSLDTPGMQQTLQRLVHSNPRLDPSVQDPFPGRPFSVGLDWHGAQVSADTPTNALGGSGSKQRAAVDEGGLGNVRPSRRSGRDGLVKLDKGTGATSFDSVSSAWSFLEKSQRGGRNAGRSSPSPSPSPSSAAESTSSQQAHPDQMQVTDSSDAHRRASANGPEVIDLTGRSKKVRRPSKRESETKSAKIVRTKGKQKEEPIESSNDEIYPGPGARKKKDRGASKATRVKIRKEPDSGGDENMVSGSGGEHTRALKPKRKGKKKIKVLEPEPEPEPEPELESEQGLPEAPKKRKKKKRPRAAEEAENNADVEMEMEIEAEEVEEPPRRSSRRHKRKPHESETEDTIQPLIKKISSTRVTTTTSSGSSRNSKHPMDPASASDARRAKKRKRPSDPLVSPIFETTAAPTSPLTSPSGLEAVLRRDEIQLQLQEINLRKHELSVRESELKLELKRLGLQARLDVEAQGGPSGQTYANCVCSACGEFGHNKTNRFKCTRHPKYVDWYASAQTL